MMARQSRAVALLSLAGVASRVDAADLNAAFHSHGPDPNSIISPGRTLPSPLSLKEGDASDGPLVSHVFTADPAGHVFDGELWVYTSHDQPNGSGEGADRFQMRDYRAFSFPDTSSLPRDEGVILSLENVPWASKMMWAPDVARDANGTYHLFFPAKDALGVFRIGHAVASEPQGPFAADPQPITGSTSIDPCIFLDNDVPFLYYGGRWAGQLELDLRGEAMNERTVLTKEMAASEALGPLVAKLEPGMRNFAEEPRQIRILDEDGEPIKEGDKSRRFFEAAWVHKRNRVYFLSYSTGETHLLVYATSHSPYGPFTYRGVLLPPVVGWTTHHSVVEFGNQYWLLHHDSTLSGGDTYRRCIKAARLFHHDTIGGNVTIGTVLKGHQQRTLVSTAAPATAAHVVPELTEPASARAIQETLQDPGHEDKMQKLTVPAASVWPASTAPVLAAPAPATPAVPHLTSVASRRRLLQAEAQEERDLLRLNKKARSQTDKDLARLAEADTKRTKWSGGISRGRHSLLAWPTAQARPRWAGESAHTRPVWGISEHGGTRQRSTNSSFWRS